MSLTTDEFLTAADLVSLTGYRHAKQQAEELERRGIPFLPGAHGRPQVSRHHTRLIAQGVEVRQSVGPDFSKVR